MIKVGDRFKYLFTNKGYPFWEKEGVYQIYKIENNRVYLLRMRDKQKTYNEGVERYFSVGDFMRFAYGVYPAFRELKSMELDRRHIKKEI